MFGLCLALKEPRRMSKLLSHDGSDNETADQQIHSQAEYSNSAGFANKAHGPKYESKAAFGLGFPTEHPDDRR